MIEVIITIVVTIIVAILVIFLLFYFGLINSYHPKKKVKKGTIKVACVGDSITYGCMVANRNKNNYPSVLNELLGEDYCVVYR